MWYVPSQLLANPSPHQVVHLFSFPTIKMNAKSNSHTFTYDGIDVCGERLANEILEECEKLQESNFRITKISVVAYSQGGLTSRYALGVLHSYKFFDKIEPVVKFCS